MIHLVHQLAEPVRQRRVGCAYGMQVVMWPRACSVLVRLVVSSLGLSSISSSGGWASGPVQASRAPAGATPWPPTSIARATALFEDPRARWLRCPFLASPTPPVVVLVPLDGWLRRTSSRSGGRDPAASSTKLLGRTAKPRSDGLRSGGGASSSAGRVPPPPPPGPPRRVP